MDNTNQRMGKDKKKEQFSEYDKIVTKMAMRGQITIKTLRTDASRIYKKLQGTCFQCADHSQLCNRAFLIRKF